MALSLSATGLRMLSSLGREKNSRCFIMLLVKAPRLPRKILCYYNQSRALGLAKWLHS